MNDSLLVQSYVDAYDMSYPEAMRKVEVEVGDLMKQLERNGECTLHGIGVLSVNSDKSVVFEPCAAGLLTPTLYALNHLEFHRLSENVVEKRAADAGKQARRKARVIYIDKDEESGQAMLNVSVSALRQVAVAAMVAILFVLAINTDIAPGSEQIEKYRSGVLSFLYSSKPSLSTIVTEKEAVAQEEADKAAKAEQEEQSFWTIVLCCQVSNKNADWFNDNMHKEGIESEAIHADNSAAKVVYGHYATQEDAQSSLRQMKDNKHFAQAWILHVEK